jgi:tRNA pseudouridine38-40 synthase
MTAFALLLAYDGSDFFGWWRQPGMRTVAGVLDEAFVRIGEPAAAAIGASRTDAGVHARGQVAVVSLARSWRPPHLQRALSPHLPPDLSCQGVACVDEEWNPAHAAIGKTYSYWIDNGAIGDPFSRRTAWRPAFRLDINALAQAAALIPGRRDWRAFVRRGDEREDTVRTISEVTWQEQGDFLICSITGEGFIYRLARSLVGGMVAVANETCSLDHLRQALGGEESPAGAQQAPARGLCLEQVEFETALAWEHYDPRAAKAATGTPPPEPA